MRKFITDILAKANLGVEQNAYVLGTVGIGTSSPVAKFDVNGTSVMRGRLTINKSTPETYGQLNVWDTTAGNGISRFADFTNGTDNNLNFYVSQVGATTKYSEIASYSSNPLVFNNASGGNVGIGTSNPGTKLQIDDTSSPTIRLNASSASGGAGSLQFYNQGVQKFNLTTVANSNDFGLYNNGGTNSFNLYIQHANGNATFSSSVIAANYYASNGGFFGWGDSSTRVDGDSSNQYIRAVINNTERLRIDPAGNVGIGTSSPAYKLDVNGRGYFGGSVLIEANETSLPLFYAKQTGTSGYTAIQFSGNNGTDIGALTTYNGQIYFGSWNGGNGSSGQLQINKTTGAATFSSSVTASSFGGNSYPYNSILGSGADASTGTIFAGSTSGYASSIDVAGGGATNPNTIIFKTASTEKMRITSGGDVLVGTTTSIFANANRGVVQVNGGLTAIFALTTGGTDSGYLYHTGTDMLVWNTKAGYVAIGTNNSEKMRVTSAGNVGIGTTSPSAKLQVAGEIRSSLGSTYGYVALQTGGATVQGYVEWFKPGPGRIGYMGYNDGSTANNLGLNLESSANFVINGGNVGIGTTSPSTYGANLAVIGSGNGIIAVGQGTSYTTFQSNGQDFYLNMKGSGSTVFRNGSGDTERVRINASGNVGIGTTNPYGRLHVTGDYNGAQNTLNLENNWPNTYSTSLINFWAYYNATNPMAVIEAGQDVSATNAGVIAFKTMTSGAVPSTKMIIKPDGNVGIGTTAPTAPLTVAGTTDLAWAASTSKLQISRSGSLARLQNYDAGSVANMALQWEGGNVGIGTSSPGFKLTVAGDSGNWATKFSSGTASAYFALSEGYGASIDAGTSATSSTYLLQLVSNGSTRMYVRGDGNVGIGTTSPSSKFEVAGKSLSRTTDSGWGQSAVANPNDTEVGFVWAAGGTGYPGVDSTYTRQWIAGLSPFGTGTDRWSLTNKTLGANTAITVLEAGNVGIGTTSPYAKLDVSGTVLTTSTLGSTAGSYAIDHPGINTWKIGVTATNSSTFHIGNDTGGSFVNKILNITAGGNVGIGTTSPANKLVVTSDASPTSENSYSIAAASASDPAYKTVIGYSYANDVGLIAAVRTAIGWRNISMPQGNLGIGTLSPLSRIQSQIESSGSALMLVNANGGGGAYVDLDFNTYTPYQSGYANPGATIRVVDNGAYSGNITFRTKGASIGAAQSERMRIEASTGNVGINNTSPAYKLDVIGNIRSYSGFTSNGYHADTFIQNILPSSNNGAATGDVQLRMWCSEPGVTWDWAGFGYNVINDGASPYGFGRLNSGFGQAYMRFSPSGAMYFYNTTTGNVRTNTMSFSDIGNVGIGTTSTVVNSLLNVAGGINTTTGIIGYETSDAFTLNGKTQPYYGFNLNPTGSSPIGISGYYGVALATQGSERMRILQNGNVGIGTSSPGYRLDVNVASTSDALRIQQGGNSRFIFNGDGVMLWGGSSANAGYLSWDTSVAIIGGQSGNALALYAAGERMRITTAGNVGIGTTSPATKLHLTGTTTNITITDTTYSRTSNIGYLDSANLYFANDNNSNTYIGRYNGVFLAYGGGNVGVGTTSPSYKLHVEGNVSGISIYASHDIAAFSDITVKKEVKRIENAIEKVKELNGYTYVRTDDETGTRRAGVIAQEVQKVLPEVVSANPDGTLNVAYSNMIALLIEGMKEQQKEIDELKKLLKK